MIQVYTGNGKGKTTASIGLALRAAGAGKNVYIAQFAKGRLYSEIKALRRFNNIKVEQFGRRCFIKKTPERVDIQMANKGLKRAGEIISKKKFQLVILDEINIAVKLKLLSLGDLLKLIKSAPRSMELILTGRYAHPKVIGLADLVSEVKELKHYYNKGIKARRGIEF
ncbi:MAG: cob(I)yrinic acid a,c-diamide adenosyltransferase [Candidatus Omnitrophica bacterium]|nr:cob(I)yrinic acid a,c-diamide adenosyltransferase [Candidatus Omnitrophota bacterium]MDD5660477.1 cob(I)yrinic acid a,c-diamide adenosyltransferase [Candidatus Omnitrophota bacterium]